MTSICFATEQIYQYQDADGNWVISNHPDNNAKKHKGRRQILHEELAHELLALKQEQDLLARNSKMNPKNNNEYQEQNAALRDAISEHQKNINILNKQLGYSPK